MKEEAERNAAKYMREDQERRATKQANWDTLLHKQQDRDQQEKKTTFEMFQKQEAAKK